VTSLPPPLPSLTRGSIGRSRSGCTGHPASPIRRIGMVRDGQVPPGGAARLGPARRNGTPRRRGAAEC
jgi:hypothetical protein